MMTENKIKHIFIFIFFFIWKNKLYIHMENRNMIHHTKQIIIDDTLFSWGFQVSYLK